ncbi:hypothetical protein ANN_08293 [Periplaneta americana]|uniref:Reverse transcriptase domain-containing protein n=1 Tax=Periplaneta americana TaxID=6978 RepID=A0ABQ8T106_PERAM|nr:hypothetical protein ANN_08293 [Periplaneta americana]
MAGLCEGGNEPLSSLKATCKTWEEGRRIKCIRFADDMALLVEKEMILKNMLLKLNDSCEQYGKNVNVNKTKSIVIGRKIQKINLRIVNEAVEQVYSFKYLSEEKQIKAFEMWMWRRMERVKWTDRIRNEAVLERVGEERMMLKLIRKRKRNWLGHWLRRNCLLKDALEGMVNGRRVRGRRTFQMIDDIKIYGSYEETKRNAENRKDWRLGLQ